MNILDLRQQNNPDNPQKEHEVIASPEINPQRRQFLKFLLVGGGAFVLGLLAKSLGFSGLFSKSKGIQNHSGPQSETQLEKDFKNWKIIENNKQAIFIDKKTNEKVLILDQEDKNE